MGIVKSVRRMAGAAGAVLDAEDRLVLAQLIVWAIGLLVACVIVAFAFGLAWRVFTFVGG